MIIKIKGGSVMKISKGLLISICIVMFLVSCAGAPNIPFKTMVEEADNRVGESVNLGGYILDSKIRGDRTDITILQTPLDWNTKPQTRDKSEGRFFASHNGIFNAEDYSSDDRITVTGNIAGLTEEKVEHCPSPCLKIESSKIRMWRANVPFSRPMGGPGI
jgi:starvation-inducible outer membrane lipoprotein